jgi:hypothetical protein
VWLSPLSLPSSVSVAPPEIQPHSNTVQYCNINENVQYCNINENVQYRNINENVQYCNINENVQYCNINENVQYCNINEWPISYNTACVDMNTFSTGIICHHH